MVVTKVSITRSRCQRIQAMELHWPAGIRAKVASSIPSRAASIMSQLRSKAVSNNSVASILQYSVCMFFVYDQVFICSRGYVMLGQPHPLCHAEPAAAAKHLGRGRHPTPDPSLLSG